MQKIIHKFICWLVGCNYICLHRHEWQHGDWNYSTSSGWKCIRCGNQLFEQWDN